MVGDSPEVAVGDLLATGLEFSSGVCEYTRAMTTIQMVKRLTRIVTFVFARMRSNENKISDGYRERG
jgi:hypothetical protein